MKSKTKKKIIRQPALKHFAAMQMLRVVFKESQQNIYCTLLFKQECALTLGTTW
jgi:hypothetical protein